MFLNWYLAFSFQVIYKNMETILFLVKQSDFIQQIEFHKVTRVHLINLSKRNKGPNSAILIYYLEMMKCLLNFVHIKKLLRVLVKHENFRICIREVTLKTNMIHTIILISPVDLPILKQTTYTLLLRYLILLLNTCLFLLVIP